MESDYIRSPEARKGEANFLQAAFALAVGTFLFLPAWVALSVYAFEKGPAYWLPTIVVDALVVWVTLRTRVIQRFLGGLRHTADWREVVPPLPPTHESVAVATDPVPWRGLQAGWAIASLVGVGGAVILAILGLTVLALGAGVLVAGAAWRFAATVRASRRSGPTAIVVTAEGLTIPNRVSPNYITNPAGSRTLRWDEITLWEVTWERASDQNRPVHRLRVRGRVADLMLYQEHIRDNAGLLDAVRSLGQLVVVLSDDIETKVRQPA